MDSEEQIFDFMVAAEDTGKRLDEMAKRLPGELRLVLTEEWRRSPWLAELPKAIGEAREATNQTETATQSLARTVKKSGSIVAIAAAIIPLATLGIAYWTSRICGSNSYTLSRKTPILWQLSKPRPRRKRRWRRESQARKAKSGSYPARRECCGAKPADLTWWTMAVVYGKSFFPPAQYSRGDRGGILRGGL